MYVHKNTHGLFPYKTILTTPFTTYTTHLFFYHQFKSMVIASYHKKYNLKTRILLYQAEMTLISNVLKTGPDRPVRRIELSTGNKTGPVLSKKSFCIEPDENKMNRRLNR